MYNTANLCIGITKVLWHDIYVYCLIGMIVITTINVFIMDSLSKQDDASSTEIILIIINLVVKWGCVLILCTLRFEIFKYHLQLKHPLKILQRQFPCTISFPGCQYTIAISATHQRMVETVKSLAIHHIIDIYPTSNCSNVHNGCNAEMDGIKLRKCVYYVDSNHDIVD
eukprot:100000_1